MGYVIQRQLQQAIMEIKGSEGTKIQVVPFQLALDLLNDIESRSITWDVVDFEQRAREIEEWEFDKNFDDMDVEVPEEFMLYDRSKFSEALVIMMKEHDCNNGITWDTVEYWLNEFCKA